MKIARPVTWASTGLLQDKLPKHRARPVARASTELIQDKPLNHRARPAVRASSELEQEDPLKHRVRSVPRTRTRLLRVVFKPTAGVIGAILGPTEALAQRVWQESTRHQQDRPIARTAGQGRILQQ